MCGTLTLWRLLVALVIGTLFGPPVAKWVASWITAALMAFVAIAYLTYTEVRRDPRDLLKNLFRR